MLTKIESSLPTIATDAHQFQPFQVDDVVKVIGDTAMVKRMQKGHGEWVESMREVGVINCMDNVITNNPNRLLAKWDVFYKSIQMVTSNWKLVVDHGHLILSAAVK